MNVFEKIREKIEMIRTRNSSNWVEVEDVVDIIDQVEEGYSNGWISVEERLPDRCCHCLVTYKNKYAINVREDVYLELEGIWDWQSNFEGSHSEVIAWRLLPKPFVPNSTGKE